jgi:hypothetical protein
LTELVEKRCLHFEAVGKEHFYTVKKKGLGILAKHEEDLAADSVNRLGQLDLPRLLRLLNNLKGHVRTSWCQECGGSDIERNGGILQKNTLIEGNEVEEEEPIDMCAECQSANVVYGTLAEYEAYVKDKGFKVPSFNLDQADENEVKERERFVKSKRDELLERSYHYALQQDALRRVLEKKRSRDITPS